MSPILQSLGIDQLSVDERLVLVQEIWNSIPESDEGRLLSEEQRLELRRRVADDDANPDDAMPWETVLAEVMARLER